MLSPREKQILSTLGFKEARGEGSIGILAVYWTVINRLNANSWFGNSIEEVCFKPYQYSCFNDSRNLLPLPYNIDCYVLTEVLYFTKDLTAGATHYHANYIRPYWADSLTETFQYRNHIFYK